MSLLHTIKEQEKSYMVSWDNGEGTDNWVVQFWKKDKDGKSELFTQIDKNSDEGGNFSITNHRTSLIAIFEENIKRLEGLKYTSNKRGYDGNDLDSACKFYQFKALTWDEVIRYEQGHNDAIDKEITYYQHILEELREE